MPIENFKRAFNQTCTIKDYVELAIKIQQAPITKKTTEDLSEILDMIRKIVDCFYNQLEKGIAIEKELGEIEAMSKKSPGAEIYIVPKGCSFDPTVLPPFSLS